MTTLLCLAATIYFEARNQPEEGQRAVAEVVINRVQHDRFPDSICEVVHQPSAFSYLQQHSPADMLLVNNYAELLAAVKAMLIAQDYIDGYRIGISSTHYHTTAILPYWANAFKTDGKIGDHLFYTCSGYC